MPLPRASRLTNSALLASHSDPCEVDFNDLVVLSGCLLMAQCKLPTELRILQSERR